MNQLRELFNDKKFMAENYKVGMSYQDFTKAYAARGEMLGNLAFGKKNAFVSKKRRNGRRAVRYGVVLPAHVAKLRKAA